MTKEKIPNKGVMGWMHLFTWVGILLALFLAWHWDELDVMLIIFICMWVNNIDQKLKRWMRYKKK